MSISLDEVFKNQIIGAINTYIRMINDLAMENKEELEIIDNEWYSYLEEDGETFVAILKIYNIEEKFYFKEWEWKRLNINMFANEQLQDLQKRFS
ncbi:MULTISPECIES: hypothetical protein [Bacillus cereus group]|uniref:hypothetical protein n=1 Tax=Bacillus cereus group TaxID=86661 RepID=UPI00114601C1|nr:MULTISPECIES: hypothetical protein [Bacillus cereus group]HDR6244294.1 hypothetical protein [Bacillus cereus]